MIARKQVKFKVLYTAHEILQFARNYIIAPHPLSQSQYYGKLPIPRSKNFSWLLSILFYNF
jgi:hypothetical protein